MRLEKPHFGTSILAALLFAACSCQSAQKPVTLLPPGTVPALKPAVGPAPASNPASSQTPASSASAESSQAESSAGPAQAKQDQTKDVPASKPNGAATEQVEAPTGSAPSPSTDSNAIAGLVARVEKDYQAGLASYKAGDTAAAKKSFDNAFNALLGSNYDIRSDERLQNEFDRISAGVNQLETGLTTPPVSDGSSDAEAQQKSEPAPIDETNELAPSADPNLKAKVQAEIKHTHSDLPLMMTDQVAGFISYFSNRGRGNFERAFARSGRYHDMMVSILKEEGVPQDLIYLAQAESGFHPLAVSRVGARGIWQFMGSRARGYGLSHNMYVDDRQDPEKSTRAAAHHLKDLYNQFGDWYLAMAAYNSGPGTVQAAVRKTGYADFWELYRRNVLPKETRNYVPIILAVTIMAKNPSQYGLNSVEMDHPEPYDTVAIDYPVDLRLVAECVDSTQAELQDLNPSLLRLTTPRTGQFELHLPKGTKAEYEASISDVPTDMRLWWRYHVVHSGETLASLARSYHTTAKSITQANHLDENELTIDAKLVIPVTPGKHPASDTAAYARRITRYKVHRGDTVETVAENFGVPALMVRRWNGIRGDSLQGRRVLALHLPVTPTVHDGEVASRSSKTKHPKATQTAASKAPATNLALIEREPAKPTVVHHKVKTGETLYSIANAYRTTVAALKRDNRNVAILKPGMILTIQSR
jgi:membrane-bound lytic murein transglycosylase D